MIRVLLISNQEIMRVGMHSVLAREPEVAAIKAVDQFQKEDAGAYDVALVDASSCRENWSSLEAIGVNTVVFSQDADDTEMARVLSSGAQGYVVNGRSTALLMLALKAVAAGATWVDPTVAHFVGRMVQKVPVPDRADSGAACSTCMLSPRESEVLALVADGLDNKGIASRLMVSAETVKTHVRHIMEKLQVDSRTEAAVRGIKLGLVELTSVAY